MSQSRKVQGKSPRIYISYRRADSQSVAGRLYDYLTTRFGRDAVFMDVASIPVGQDFRAAIAEEISRCDVMIILIGKNWLNISDQGGQRRLYDSNDFIRSEIEYGLRFEKLVIPVLVNNARMPSTEDLPASLSGLAYRNAAALRSDPDFSNDIARLVSAIERNYSTIESRPSHSVDEAKSKDSGVRPVTENRTAIVVAIVGGVGALLAALIGLIGLPNLQIEINPFLVFLMTTFAFTLLANRLSTVGLFVGAFATGIAGFGFSQNIWVFFAVVSGALLGASKILMWLWLCFLIPWQNNRARLLLENEKSRGSTAKSPRTQVPSYLISALNIDTPLQPIGISGAMSTVAKYGIDVDTFNGLAHNKKTQNSYKQVVYSIGLRDLAKASDLQSAARVYGIGVSNRSVIVSLERSLVEIRSTSSNIEQIRLYAVLLDTFSASLKDIPLDSNPLNQLERQAIENVSRLIYQTVKSAREEYWSLYHIVTSSIKQVENNTALGFQELVNDLINGGKLLRQLDAHQSDFSASEQDIYRDLIQLIDLVSSINLSVDYVQRSKILGQSVLGLRNDLRTKVAGDWLTIDRNEDRIIKHENPWKEVMQRVVGYLEKLQELDRAYLLSVIQGINSILAKIENVEELAQLDNQLTVFNTHNAVYGNMIDNTISILVAIGRDVDAAIASLQGSYNRQIALRDAQEKLNQLHTTLETRYNKDAAEWCQSVKRLSILVDDYLKDIDINSTTGYPNPYIAGVPVQPSRAALFKGRIDLADQIISKIRSGARPTLVLHGPRRMGKTSFLLQLQNLLPGDYIVAFFNIQGTGADQGDASFFYVLARSIFQQVSRLPGGESISKPSLAIFEDRPHITLMPWIEDEVVPCLKNRTLVITIDEFELIGEALAKDKLSVNVLNALRHIMQHYHNILLMFAGVETLEALGPNAASQFIGAYAIEVSYLDRKSAEELIREPDPKAGKMPEYQAEVVNDILNLTHRQPFLLQAICSEIINIANRDELKEITASVLEEAINRVHATYSFYFQNVWESTDTHGQTLLKNLAQQPTVLSQAELNTESLKTLLQRRVICKAADGTYEIEIPLVQRWIAHQIHTPLN